MALVFVEKRGDLTWAPGLNDPPKRQEKDLFYPRHHDQTCRPKQPLEFPMLWLINQPPRNQPPPHRNKGLIAGLKGNQWLSPDHKAGYFWGSGG